jgi:hypothetical protein
MMEKPLFVTRQSLQEESFLSAILQFARPCPARSDYVELFFVTDEGTWKWCFSEPPEQPDHGSGPIALAVGTYGAQAHTIDNDGLGPALPSAEAVSAILDGADVYVARRLVACDL